MTRRRNGSAKGSPVVNNGPSPSSTAATASTSSAEIPSSPLAAQIQSQPQAPVQDMKRLIQSQFKTATIKSIIKGFALHTALLALTLFGFTVIMRLLPYTKLITEVVIDKTRSNRAQVNIHEGLTTFYFFHYSIIWVAMLGMIAMASKFIKLRTYYPTNYVSWFRWLFIGESTDALFIIGPLVALCNTCTMQSFMIIFGWEKINLDMPCPEDPGNVDCVSRHYQTVLFWVYMSSLIVFFYDYYNGYSLIKFRSFPLDFSDEIRLITVDALDDACETSKTIYLFTYTAYFVQGFVVWMRSDISNPFLAPGTHLNYDLFVYTGLWVFFSVFSMKLSVKVMLMILTDTRHLKIDMGPFGAHEGVLLLPDLMENAPNPSFLKHLAFKHFCLICSLPTRNDEEFLAFYELSFPGGHPRRWHVMLKSVLKEVKALTENCRGYIERYRPALLADINVRGQGLVQSIPPAPVIESDSSDIRRRQLFRALNIRPNPGMINEHVQAHPDGFLITLLRSPVVLVSIIKQAAFRLMNKLIRPMRGYWRHYLEAEDPGLVLLNIMCDVELVTFGVNGISEIIAESPMKDIHGVVQRDMKVIIEHLVDLYTMADLTALAFNITPARDMRITTRITVYRSTERILSLCNYALSRIDAIYSEDYASILGMSEVDRETIRKILNTNHSD